MRKLYKGIPVPQNYIQLDLEGAQVAGPAEHMQIAVPVTVPENVSDNLIHLT